MWVPNLTRHFYSHSSWCLPCVVTFASDDHLPECLCKASHWPLQHLSILQFDFQVWVVNLVLKQHSGLERTEVVPSGQSHKPVSFPGKKNPQGWGLPWNQHCALSIQKSTWRCHLMFTLGEEGTSWYLTLHFKHLQTNAKPAGHLKLSAFCLTLFSAEALLQRRDPLESPMFPEPKENAFKVAVWHRCQIISCKSISVTLGSSSCKIKNNCHRQATTEDEMFVHLFQADNGVTVDMFGLWKEH